MILASASPRRKELLALITPDYRVLTSDVDEAAITAEAPTLLAEKLACAKCKAVAQHYPQELVIGCDTVVDVAGKVLGKPHSREEARAMLHLLAGNTHLVHTGVCLRKGEHMVSFVETTKVNFLPMCEQEIESYINTDEPYDKAGGYGIQGVAARYISGIEGCYFNVMGFPVARVHTALKEFAE